MSGLEKKGYKNIIALDFDDLRTREIPKIFKGSNFITLKLISSNPEQIKNQMEKRHKSGQGLYDIDNVVRSNQVIYSRPILPNEFIVDVCNKSEDEVFKEAVELIDNAKTLLEYNYRLADRKYFLSWVKSNNLN